jgi:galactokinase
VKRELASSAYNERRRECEESVALLRARLPEVRALRDVVLRDLEEHSDLLRETLRRRCRHVITENARTLDAVRALSRGDMKEVGRLMSESHESLRSEYEVSSDELDLCVETALTIDGVYGSRMTGGGFGGCTVTLVAERAIDDLSGTIDHRFAERFGGHPDIFTVTPSDGMKEH